MTPSFQVRTVLLDIEGTTSSVSFVYDVLFPYAERELANYLRQHWGEESLIKALEHLARDAGYVSWREWRGGASESAARQLVETEAKRLMASDAKATGLKQLQGLIWKQGFVGGELQSHVYTDVPPALRAWCKAGFDLRIYSSGSIAAQKLFFAHTIAGDLLDLFSGHYDTTTGGKKDFASYRTIAADVGIPPGEILFASDIVAELDAAREAGLQTVLLKRPGNAPTEDGHGHAAVADFSHIDFSHIDLSLSDAVAH